MKELVNLFLSAVLKEKSELSTNFTNLSRTKLGKSIDLTILNHLDDKFLNDKDFIFLLVNLVVNNTDDTISLIDQYLKLDAKIQENVFLASCVISFNGGEIHSLNNDPYFYSTSYKNLPKSLMKNKEFLLNVLVADSKVFLLDHIRKLFNQKMLLELENDIPLLKETFKNEKYEGTTLILFKTKIENIDEECILYALKEENFAVFKRPEIINKFKGKLSEETRLLIEEVLVKNYATQAYFSNALPEEFKYEDIKEVKNILNQYL